MNVNCVLISIPEWAGGADQKTCVFHHHWEAGRLHELCEYKSNVTKYCGVLRSL